MAAHGPRTVAAILVAAGNGLRLGADRPKAFVPVGGRSLIEHALDCFVGHPAIDDVIVVAPSSHLEQASALCPPGVRVVVGGATRQASVLSGLDALANTVDIVLVHDVARPFVPAEVITAVLAALAAGADAAIPVVATHDTVRRVDSGGAFVEIVDRSALVAVQTPQGFTRAALVAAHGAGHPLAVADAAADAAADDVAADAALIEATGGRVVAVPGADAAFKITRPWDLAMAEAVVAGG